MSTITTILETDIIKDSRAVINANFAALNADKLEAATVATLTNKTFDVDGTGNVLSNVADANIKSGANIALAKLIAVTANRALVSDASGVMTAATVTSTELAFLSGVTSAIQTQLDAKGVGAAIVAFAASAVIVNMSVVSPAGVGVADEAIVLVRPSLLLLVRVSVVAAPIPPRLESAVAASVAFVPPFAIGRVPVTPVVRGSPVPFVRTIAEGVPPAPLNVMKAPAEPIFIARAVATPVPKPDIPVETGSPVTFVITPEAGVPRAGVTNVGEVPNTRAPVPVSSEITPRSCSEVVAAN